MFNYKSIVSKKNKYQGWSNLYEVIPVEKIMIGWMWAPEIKEKNTNILLTFILTF